MTHLLRPTAAAAAALLFAPPLLAQQLQTAVPPAATQPTSTRAAAATAPTTRPVAQVPHADPTDPAFAAAVADLGADNWKKRQAAQETLVRFGDQAVPRLRQLAQAADDEEIRTRAGAALRQIEENAQVGPTTLTLHVKDAPAKAVFAEIATQARCEFPTFPPNLWDANPGTPVTLDLDRVNFWTGFKEVCQRTGLYPMQGGNDRRMTLQQNANNTNWNGPSVVSGPFLVVANRIHRANSVDLTNAAAPVQHEFTLVLSAFAEPKIRVVQAGYYADVDEAVDDRGHSLVATDRVYGTTSSGQQWMWNATARLAYPDRDPGTRIARLKGHLTFLIQTRSETLDVPDLLTAHNLTRTVAGRRIVLNQVKATGEQYEVQMTIHRDGLSAREWNAMQNPGYAVRVTDKDGNPLAANGWGGSSGVNQLVYTWTFNRNVWNGRQNKVGEPHRLVWEIPTETREVTVPFEFKDLPIP